MGESTSCYVWQRKWICGTHSPFITESKIQRALFGEHLPTTCRWIVYTQTLLISWTNWSEPTQVRTQFRIGGGLGPYFCVLESIWQPCATSHNHKCAAGHLYLQCFLSFSFLFLPLKPLFRLLWLTSFLSYSVDLANRQRLLWNRLTLKMPTFSSYCPW